MALVLILFEESQEVTRAFRERGHQAYSCDLKLSSGGRDDWHFKMDIYDALKLGRWDFVGMHPPCTAMTLSGNRHYAKGKPRYDERVNAVEWTIKLWDDVCGLAEFVYMENPMGVMNGDNRLPKPQVIQPYYFGDKAMKTTCLWLKGLPYLYHNDSVSLFDDTVTHTDRGVFHVHSSGKRMNDFHYKTSLLPQKDRAEARSKTFPGIARAMAEQWGVLLK